MEERKLNEFGKPKATYEETARALETPQYIKDARKAKKELLKQELKAIAEIVLPIGKLIYINENADTMECICKDTGQIRVLVKSGRKVEEDKEIKISNLAEYGGFLTEIDIDEILK